MQILRSIFPHSTFFASLRFFFRLFPRLFSRAFSLLFSVKKTAVTVETVVTLGDYCRCIEIALGGSGSQGLRTL